MVFFQRGAKEFEKNHPKDGILGVMEIKSKKLSAGHGLRVMPAKSSLAIKFNPHLVKLGKFLHAKQKQYKKRFRNIIVNKRFSKVVGINLTALFLSTSLIQFPFQETEVADENFVTKAPFVLETKKSVQYPVVEIKITQGYKLFHSGVDFDGITGDPIYPIMDGRVEAINYSKYAYGNAVLIDHGDNITSLYAHLSKILVKPNQEVTTDTIIGEMGSTGRSSGDHLHLEIRDSGKPFNPLTALPKTN